MKDILFNVVTSFALCVTFVFLLNAMLMLQGAIPATTVIRNTLMSAIVGAVVVLVLGAIDVAKLNKK